VPVCIDCDVALAPDNFLGPVEAARAGGGRGLDRLAVDDSRARVGIAAGSLPVDHQRNIVDGAEQQQPNEAAKPPIDRLPGWKVDRQHAPFAPRANHIADRIQDLAQVCSALAARPSRRGQKRPDSRPFLIGQVARVSSRLLLNGGHSAAAFNAPHPNRESRQSQNRNSFQTDSEALHARSVSFSNAM